MKLYTEEQIKQIVLKSRETGLTAEYLMLTHIPIELPSDEEIEKELDSWEKQSLRNEALLLEAQRQMEVAKSLLRRADMIMASNYSPTVALWHTNYGDFLASLEKAKESENESGGEENLKNSNSLPFPFLCPACNSECKVIDVPVYKCTSCNGIFGDN